MIPNKKYNANEHIRELVDSSCQGVKKLFVLTYDNVNGITADSHKRYFLPRIKIKMYNIEIDGRNFYDQSINQLLMTQLSNMMKSEKYQQDKVTITQLVVY